MLHRLAFLLEPRQHTPKHFEYDQIKIKIFGLKRQGYEASEKRKAKNYKLPLSRRSKNKRCRFLWKISHKIFPLFDRFSTFDKNVNLSKANQEAENFFLAFPLLNTSIFYDGSKNSEHIKTFREARLKSHPPKFRSLTFLNKEKVNSQSGKVFKLLP